MLQKITFLLFLSIGICLSVLPSDRNLSSKGLQKVYKQKRSIEDLPTLDEINRLLPSEIQKRKKFIADYRKSLSEAQRDPAKWDGTAGNSILQQLWRTPTLMNMDTLSIFNYPSQTIVDYNSPEDFSAFFNKNFNHYSDNKLIEEFKELNKQIIEIKKEITDIPRLKYFINTIQSLQDKYRELPKNDINKKLEILKREDTALEKSSSPMISNERRAEYYIKALDTLKNIQNYANEMVEVISEKKSMNNYVNEVVKAPEIDKKLLEEQIYVPNTEYKQVDSYQARQESVSQSMWQKLKAYFSYLFQYK